MRVAAERLAPRNLQPHTIGRGGNPVDLAPTTKSCKEKGLQKNTPLALPFPKIIPPHKNSQY